MKKFVLIALLLVSAPASSSADLVIDNFSVPLVEQPASSALVDDFLGTRTLNISNNTSIFGSSTLQYGNPGNEIFTLNYLLDASIELIDQALNFSYKYDSPGTPDNIAVEFRVFNSDNNQVYISTPPIETLSDGTVQTVTSSSLVIADAKRFELRVQRLTPATALSTITLNSFFLTAVPEPGTVTLVGLTMVAGWFIRKRRAGSDADVTEGPDDQPAILS